MGTHFEDTLQCRYIIYGREVGESGTPHLQGFVMFDNQRTLKAVIKLFKGAHVEVAVAPLQAIEYCKKEGDFVERGSPPMSQAQKGEKEKERWADILKAAQEGREEDIDPEIRFKYDRNIERIRDRELRKRKLEDTEEKHQWYCGASGTGKSRKARSENPDAYLKMCNKWWDGYVDQEVVLVEDFDKKHDVLCHHLKIWADRYPFPAEMKGSSVVIRPEKIIVTSNWHPREIWTEEGDLGPILRRFHVTKFTEFAGNGSGGVE